MIRLPARHDRAVVVTAVGIAQIFAFGATYYLPAVLAKAIASDTGWAFTWVSGGLSLAMLASALLAPLVGRLIQRHGGRFVLTASAVLLAAGLVLMSLSQSIWVYLVAWLVVGAGMAAGLYDAAFSALGRLYGTSARGAITWVTLFGGFASTVCWPLSAWLVESFGWRVTCLVYAAAYLCISLPAYLVCVPQSPTTATTTPEADKPTAEIRPAYAFYLLALILTFAGLISSMLSVHLLALLQERGMSLAIAVAFGTIVGPSQVAGRLIELLTGGKYHPIWGLVAAVGSMALGLVLLASGWPVTALALLLYGAGNGILTIAKGTLPLVLFEARLYPIVIGRLALPALIVQALAPVIGAWLLQAGGAMAMHATLLAASFANLVLTWALFRRTRGNRE